MHPLLPECHVEMTLYNFHIHSPLSSSKCLMKVSPGTNEGTVVDSPRYLWVRLI